MKNKILIFFLLFFSTLTKGQTLYVADSMENPASWRGVSSMVNSMFIGGLSSSIDNPPNYPMYSSYDSCYMIKGTGTGSSTIERDTFTYSNLPVVPGKTYEIRYKVASFGLNYSVQTAAGVDGGDTIEFQFRLANSTWFRDARIIGNNNSMWSFDGAIGTNVKLNIFRNSGTVPNIYVSNPTNPITNMTIRLTPGTYSTIQLRFVTAINGSGETWMIDDVEVWDVTPVLPIELIEFNGKYYNSGLKLYWSTASEINNDYFILYKSFDGTNFQEVTKIKGRGNSNTMVKYEYVDHDLCEGIVYYNLKQVDYDGNSKEFDIIAFQCRSEYIIEKFTDILGRKIGQEYDGIKVYYK